MHAEAPTAFFERVVYPVWRLEVSPQGCGGSQNPKPYVLMLHYPKLNPTRRPVQRSVFTVTGMGHAISSDFQGPIWCTGILW